MALFPIRPIDNEAWAFCQTTSIGATPVAAGCVAPIAGYIQRVFAVPGGTTTGTITVSVTINGGSDITNSGLTIAAASNARNNPAFELALVGAGTTSGVLVNEGDFITFTPSGGGGANIIGAFGVAIRAN